jgi:hypothetical protein
VCTPERKDIDPVVAEMCVDVIRKNLGTLDDLPRELANTVANVYYRFLNLGADMAARRKQNPGWLPPHSGNEGGLKESLVTFMHTASSCITDSESVKGFIEGLRGIDKNSQPRLYDDTVEFILDCLKYNIPNICEKSLLRRRFERHFYKHRVTEIPGLADRLGV